MLQDMDLVRRWARRYYEMGLNPLPSCGHAKRPALNSRDCLRYREEMIPEKWLETFHAPNIQIPLGVRWRVVVVDIDGEEALSRWIEMMYRQTCFTSWVSGAPRIGDGLQDWSKSRHVWYLLPSFTKVFPTVTLWRGGNHQEIKILGDRALAVVPPSVHPERCTPYQWLVGPDDFRAPAQLPDWLLKLCEQARCRAPSAPRPRPQRHPLPLGSHVGRHYQRDEVLYALGDRKHEIAERYGLEVRHRPNSGGFHECRSLSREDNRWSCTMDPRTGVYRDFAMRESLSFFDVLMRLDPQEFPDFSTTVDKLGAYVFGGRPCPSKK